MALDTTSLAALLEALRSWLIDNPDGDIQEFAAEHGVEVAGPRRRLAGPLRAGRLQPQLRPGHGHHPGRRPGHRPGGPRLHALRAPAVRLEPRGLPRVPDPGGPQLPGVHDRQQHHEQHRGQLVQPAIIASDVQQEIDIDNSDVEQGDNSVNIDDSTLTDSPSTPATSAPRACCSRATATRPTPATSAPATAVRPGLRRRHHRRQRQRQLGDGQNAVTTAVGDDNQQATVNQENETDVEQDITTGDSGDAARRGRRSGRRRRRRRRRCVRLLRRRGRRRRRCRWRGRCRHLGRHGFGRGRRRGRQRGEHRLRLIADAARATDSRLFRPADRR